MSFPKNDVLIAAAASVVTLVACTALAGPAVDLAGQAAEVVAGAPSDHPATTVGGVDIIEVLILGLAALGLGPVARILALLRPVLTPILRAALGKKADSPSPALPPPSPKPE